MISKEKFIELWVLRDDSIHEINQMVASIKIAATKYNELLMTEGVGINFHEAILTLRNASCNLQSRLDETKEPTLVYQKEVLEKRRIIWDAMNLLAKITEANTGIIHNYGVIRP